MPPGGSPRRMTYRSCHLSAWMSYLGDFLDTHPAWAPFLPQPPAGASQGHLPNQLLALEPLSRTKLLWDPRQRHLPTTGSRLRSWALSPGLPLSLMPVHLAAALSFLLSLIYQHFGRLQGCHEVQVLCRLTSLKALILLDVCM